VSSSTGIPVLISKEARDKEKNKGKEKFKINGVMAVVVLTI
jgi:hypothetical protein